MAGIAQFIEENHTSEDDMQQMANLLNEITNLSPEELQAQLQENE